MFAQGDQLGLEGPVRPEAGLDGHRARDVGGACDPLGTDRREDPQCEHALGPIDQGQALLVQQLDRFQALGAQCARAVGELAVDLDLSLAHERQCEVSQGSEVSGCPEGSLRRDYWMDTCIEHVDESAEDLETDARDAEREGSGP